MAKERSLVRASDIGSYAFCRRAWFLAQVKGVPHSDPARLAAGVAAHAEHGVLVRRTGHADRVGRVLLAAGGFLLLAALLLWWLT
jgi:hypothetical protein